MYELRLSVLEVINDFPFNPKTPDGAKLKHLHLLTLFPLLVYGVSVFSQDARLHLIVHHQSLLCGVDIDTPRLHFPKRKINQINTFLKTN